MGLLTSTHDEAEIGDWIGIDGYGFNANKVIHLYFSSDEANIGDYIDDEVTAYEYIGTAYINTDGKFDTRSCFKISDKLIDGKDEEDVHGGDYYVYATYYFGKKRIEAVAKFVVIDGEIELDPKEGPVGTEVEISGEGLRKGQKITIEYDGEEIDIAGGDEQTDSDGKFTCTIIIPESTAGTHTVTTTDGTNTVTSVFTMESEAPPMPVPLLPEVASTAEAEAHFDWEDVEDLSGVTYTLQIASDKDFTNIVLEKKGLTNSEYTITEEEKLKSTEKEAPYYWRVKAVDNAFNESEWTPSGLFYVGFSWSSIPDWVQYTFYGLGALLLAILGFWVRRRTTSH